MIVLLTKMVDANDKRFSVNIINISDFRVCSMRVACLTKSKKVCTKN